jgi:hypothetical protein
MAARAQVGEMRHDFGPSAAHTVRTEIIGREQHRVVVIDNLLRDPDALVEYAATAVEFKPLKRDVNYYPGMRAPVPQEYLATLYGVIKPFMSEVFGLPVDGRLKANCSFSLATLPPERLNLFQRLPHFDTVDGRQLAVLHYLCDGSHGGTAFYRHRESGYESINEERLAHYMSLLEKDIDASGPPPAQYMSGDDSRFEQIASFEAQFDRVLIYRSQLLHSGSVRATGLSPDPRRGRLTANAFFYIPR